MMSRLWAWLTSWRNTPAKPQHTDAIFDAETDPHIQWLKQQQHDSEESTRQAKRDWADVSIQERLRGQGSGWQEKVR